MRDGTPCNKILTIETQRPKELAPTIGKGLKCLALSEEHIVLVSMKKRRLSQHCKKCVVAAIQIYRMTGMDAGSLTELQNERKI